MSSMPGGSQQKRPHSLLWSADSEKSLLLQCLAKFWTSWRMMSWKWSSDISVILILLDWLVLASSWLLQLSGGLVLHHKHSTCGSHNKLLIHENGICLGLTWVNAHDSGLTLPKSHIMLLYILSPHNQI